MLKLFSRAGLLVGFLIGADGAQGRAETRVAADSEFAQGAETYTTAAIEQLVNIRRAMDATRAATQEEDRDLYDAAYRRLGECDELLAKLRHSVKSTFDANKKRFEAGLQKLIQEIERAKER